MPRRSSCLSLRSPCGFPCHHCAGHTRTLAAHGPSAALECFFPPPTCVKICHATMTILKDWRGTYRATRSTSPGLRSPLSPDITYETTARAATSNTAARTTAIAMPPALPTHFLQTKPSSEVYPSLQTAQSAPHEKPKQKPNMKEPEARMCHGFYVENRSTTAALYQRQTCGVCVNPKLFGPIH